MTRLAILAASLLAAGCASVPPVRTELLIWHNECDHKDHAAQVTVYVAAPPLACPERSAQLGLWGGVAMYAMAFPFTGACAFIGPETEDRFRYAEIWLFPGEFFLDHEMAHVRGMGHPPFLPFLQSDGCES